MNEMKFDWDDLRLFLAVARKRGLAPAAAMTGKSAPTLARRMLGMERRIGKDLFHRHARGYELTEAGHLLLVKVANVESEILPLVNVQATPIIKVSAGLWVTHLLCEHVTDIIGGDAITLRFIASDEVIDIGKREALIGVRNQRPEGIGLAGRMITRVQFAVYARDTNVQRWARVISSTPSAKWVLDHLDGADAIEVTNPRNALDLALAGTARVVLPTFIGQKLNRLQQLGSPIQELEHDQWLVTHHEDRFVPEVRKVIDRLYVTLKNQQS
ncbi:MAG: LysR family transcriptional regulator [Roseobacter sp.]